MFLFLLRLMVLLIILLPLDYFVLQELVKIEFGTKYYVAFAYFTLVVIFIQVYIAKSLKKRPQVFIWTFLGALGFKMFLSLLLLVIVVYAGVSDYKIWAVNFVSLYVAFSAFSAMQIMRAQKTSTINENNGQN